MGAGEIEEFADSFMKPPQVITWIACFSLLLTLTWTFVVPVRRLRRPDDVHHAYRETSTPIANLMLGNSMSNGIASLAAPVDNSDRKIESVAQDAIAAKTEFSDQSSEYSEVSDVSEDMRITNLLPDRCGAAELRKRRDPSGDSRTVLARLAAQVKVVKSFYMKLMYFLNCRLRRLQGRAGRLLNQGNAFIRQLFHIPAPNAHTQQQLKPEPIPSDPVLIRGSNEASTLRLFDLPIPSDSVSLSQSTTNVRQPWQPQKSIVASFDADDFVADNAIIAHTTEHFWQGDSGPQQQQQATPANILDVLSGPPTTEDRVGIVGKLELGAEGEGKSVQSQRDDVDEKDDDDSGRDDDAGPGGETFIMANVDELDLPVRIPLRPRLERFIHAGQDVESSVTSCIYHSPAGGEETQHIEWKGLVTLRNRLLASSEDTTWIREGDLLRWLREYESPEEAFGALERTCAWRTKVGLTQIVQKDYSDSPMRQELFWYGNDKDGSPILVFRTKIHKPGRISHQEYLDYALWLLERAREESGLGYKSELIFLVDRVDAGFTNQDPLLAVSVLPLLQAHFPGLFKVAYVAPVSVIFNLIWAVISSLLPPSVTQRIRLLAVTDMPGVLRQQFQQHQLPFWLGGPSSGYIAPVYAHA